MAPANSFSFSEEVLAFIGWISAFHSSLLRDVIALFLLQAEATPVAAEATKQKVDVVNIVVDVVLEM